MPLTFTSAFAANQEATQVDKDRHVKIVHDKRPIENITIKEINKDLNSIQSGDRKERRRSEQSVPMIQSWEKVTNRS